MKRYPEYIVGIDLSGDPAVSYSFLELLEMSRKAGLKIAAHCAEVNNNYTLISSYIDRYNNIHNVYT